jgi:CheY-like chemotaxis protein
MNKSILIIEDNDLNRDLVTDLLEAKGFTVIHAHEADEGLRLAQKHLPALILMDLGLPGMDGLAATRALKGDARTRELMVIALTAHAMRGDEKVALDAGCDGYLTKPIDTRRFIGQIETFISLSRDNPAKKDQIYAMRNQ